MVNTRGRAVYGDRMNTKRYIHVLATALDKINAATSRKILTAADICGMVIHCSEKGTNNAV